MHTMSQAGTKSFSLLVLNLLERLNAYLITKHANRINSDINYEDVAVYIIILL